MGLFAKLKAAAPAATPVGTGNPTNGAHPTDGPGWVDTKCSTCGESVGNRPLGYRVSAHDGCKGKPVPAQSPVTDEGGRCRLPAGHPGLIQETNALRPAAPAAVLHRDTPQ